MPNVINHYRTNDAVTVLEYDDGSKAYVHYIIPIDELGNVLTPTGGGGGGGAVTVADGADIAEGAKADTVATDTTSPWSAISLLKGVLAALRGTLAVTGTFWQTVQPVSGTFWQATQPVSATSLPLPTGAAQDGTDATGVASPAGATGIRGWLSSIFNKLNTSIAVTGTFWQAVQPVSGTFWQAKQPVSEGDGDNAALGATSDLVTASTGIGLLKAIKAALQAPLAVTGTFWQAVQPVSGTFWQATQPISATSLPLPTGASQDGTDGTGITPPTGAVGIRGWLSGIFNKLAGTLSVAQTDSTATGNITTAGTAGTASVVVATTGKSTAVANLAANGTTNNAGILFEGSLDGGATYDAFVGLISAGGGPSVFSNGLSLGSNGGFQVKLACSGFTHVRVRCTTATAVGTIAVTWRASIGQPEAIFAPLVSMAGNNVAVDGSGNLSAKAVGASGSTFINPTGDGLAGTNMLAVAPMLWNGTSWDRGDDTGTALPSAARTTTAVSATFSTPRARGILFSIEVSAKAATTSLALELRTSAGAGLATPAAAITIAVGVTGLVWYYPNLTATPGQGSNVQSPIGVLPVPTPRDWFLVVTPGDASSITYQVKYWSLY